MGIFGHSFLGFWSLPTFANFSGGFGALSPHLKIPFPAVGLEREVRPRFAPGIRDRGRTLLFRIKSERLKLPAPFGRRIAEPLDADAAGQATFYRSSDWLRRGAPGGTAVPPIAGPGEPGAASSIPQRLSP